MSVRVLIFIISLTAKMNRKEISITTKKRLAKILTFTGELELHLEFLRQNLSKLTGFEPYASFQRLDR